MTAYAETWQPSESDLRLLAQSSPGGLLLATEPRWGLPPHLRLIDDLLVRVAAGVALSLEERRALPGLPAAEQPIKRLIVEVPVRHGKSELVSRFFPAWLLGMRHNARAVVAGYGAEFASMWGEKARNILEENGPRFFGVAVDRGSRAKHNWRLDTEENGLGSMYSLGVGGQLTGRGADVLVIDDPFKNAEEADSEVMREKIWDWYWSTARTRLEPGGAIVIVMARWHEDDLVGRLLAMDAAGEGEGWMVVRLPALAEDPGEEDDFEPDALGRAPGEPLWPERYDVEELETIRTSYRAAGQLRWWNALYQQKPSAQEGVMFKRSNYRYYTTVPEQVGAISRVWLVLARDDGERRVEWGEMRIFQTGDVAISASDTADWTVISTWGWVAPASQLEPAELLLLDVDRQRFEEQQITAFMKAANDKWGRPPLWVERFGAGRNPLAILAHAGYPVIELPNEAGTKLDKVTRAFGAIAHYEGHHVFHPRPKPDWLPAYEEELVAFNRGRWDDQVDTVSYAARLLPLIGGETAVGYRKPQSPGPRPMTAGLRGAKF